MLHASIDLPSKIPARINLTVQKLFRYFVVPFASTPQKKNKILEQQYPNITALPPVRVFRFCTRKDLCCRRVRNDGSEERYHQRTEERRHVVECHPLTFGCRLFRGSRLTFRSIRPFGLLLLIYNGIRGWFVISAGRSAAGRSIVAIATRWSSTSGVFRFTASRRFGNILHTRGTNIGRVRSLRVRRIVVRYVIVWLNRCYWRLFTWGSCGSVSILIWLQSRYTSVDRLIHTI